MDEAYIQGVSVNRHVSSHGGIGCREERREKSWRGADSGTERIYTL